MARTDARAALGAVLTAIGERPAPVADPGALLRLDTVAAMGLGEAVDGAVLVFDTGFAIEDDLAELEDASGLDFAAMHGPLTVYRRLVDLVSDWIDLHRWEGGQVLGRPRSWRACAPPAGAREGVPAELEERAQLLAQAKALRADLLEAAGRLGEVIERTEAFDWRAADERARQAEIARLEGNLARLRAAVP